MAVYEVNKTLRYQFDTTTHLGVVLGTNEKIYVVTECDQRKYNAFGFVHKNKPNCLFDNPGARHLICAHPGDPLASYLDKWDREVIYRNVITSFVIPYHNYQGYHATDGKVVNYLHPKVRDIIHQMYKFVNDMHVKGYSLSSFGLDDIKIKGNDVVQFCGIGYITEPDAEARKMNFVSVEKVVKELIKFNLPTTLENLFSRNLELTHEQLEDGLLLRRHLSIIPPKEVLHFMRVSGHDLPEDKNNPTYKTIMAKVDCDNWDKDFVNEDKYGIVKMCYNHGKAATYNPRDKFSMLRFTRNLAIHLGVGIGLPGKYHLNDDQREAIIMKLFGTALLDTQLYMHKERILPKFMMEV